MNEGLWATLEVWLSYRPSDFLMFSPRIYWRLFESANRAWWPVPGLATALGLLWLCGRRPLRTGLAALGALWLLVAWVFQLERFAPIHWVAGAYAAAFALQGLWLGGAVLVGRLRARGAGWRARVGTGLVAWALVGHPLLAGLSGRPWLQAELIGVAPDATALATLGVLLLAEPDTPGQRRWWRLAFVLPFTWCLVSAATLATMGTAQALVPLAAMVVAGLALRS